MIGMRVIGRRLLVRAGLASALLSLGALAFAGPAQATHKLGWTDVSVPESAGVNFKDVGSASGVVVAIGATPGAGGTSVAEIRRRPASGADWIVDTVGLPTGATSSKLEAVALTAKVAIGVGRYTDSTGSHPLVVRLGGTAALASNSAQNWNSDSAAVVPPAGGMGLPLSVALSGDPVVGLIGAEDGRIYPLNDDGAKATITAPPPTTEETPPAKTVTGVTLFGTSGFAVGEHATANQPTDNFAPIAPIYAVSAGSADLSPTATPDPDHYDFAGVAATGTSRAVAIDKGGTPAYWERDATTGAWGRKASSLPSVTSQTHLNDVTVFDLSATSGLTAIAGDISGQGAAWRRVGAGTNWTPYTFSSAPPLNGIVAVSADELIAVGNSGVVKRLAPEPDPEPEPQQPPQDDQGGSAGPQETLPVTVEDDSNRPCNPPRLKGENVQDIEVKDRRRRGKKRGKLLISFRLRREAEVQALALRGEQVVGKTRPRVLERGEHMLRLRYRKPPETVRIKAELVDGCERKRGARRAGRHGSSAPTGARPSAIALHSEDFR